MPPCFNPSKTLAGLNLLRNMIFLFYDIMLSLELAQALDSLLCPRCPAGLVRMRQRAKTAVQRQRQPVRDIIPLSLDEVEVSIVVLPSDNTAGSHRLVALLSNNALDVALSKRPLWQQAPGGHLRSATSTAAGAAAVASAAAAAASSFCSHCRTHRPELRVCADVCVDCYCLQVAPGHLQSAGAAAAASCLSGGF